MPNFRMQAEGVTEALKKLLQGGGKGHESLGTDRQQHFHSYNFREEHRKEDAHRPRLTDPRTGHPAEQTALQVLGLRRNNKRPSTSYVSREDIRNYTAAESNTFPKNRACFRT